jgi:hypothetical protein
MIQIRETGRRIYLVGKNKEYSKVFEHCTLGDHLQVKHPTHGCQMTLSDIKHSATEAYNSHRES